MLRPLQDVPAAINRFLLTPHHLGHGFTKGPRALVERRFQVGQPLFLRIEVEVAGIARRLPLIRDALPLVGDAIPLVRDSLALVLKLVGWPHQAFTRDHAVPDGVSCTSTPQSARMARRRSASLKRCSRLASPRIERRTSTRGATYSRTSSRP